MANRHMKNISSSLAVSKMQVKTPVRYRYSSIGRAKIKRTDNKYWPGCGTTRILLRCNGAYSEPVTLEKCLQYLQKSTHLQQK